ncbi:MAG: helix-turn-helix transcriptional regulator, partial [Pseudomonadota bacterium]
MDKRDIAQTFRERLTRLVQRHDGNLARFADAAGLDRSALSQFLAPGATRLPRAESLCRIAEANGVSLDWLLGISQSESNVSDVAPMLTIERPVDESGRDSIDAWHADAMGYKIRYVPAALPDLLRLDDVTEAQYRRDPASDVTQKADQSRRQLDYTRRPETDMEV